MLMSSLQNLSPRLSGGISGLVTWNSPMLPSLIPSSSLTSSFNKSVCFTNSILNRVSVLKVYSSLAITTFRYLALYRVCFRNATGLFIPVKTNTLLTVPRRRGRGSLAVPHAKAQGTQRARSCCLRALRVPQPGPQGEGSPLDGLLYICPARRPRLRCPRSPNARSRPLPLTVK